MIEIIRREQDPDADWVEAGLKELVLGYKRTLVSEPPLPDQTLPLLRHDARLYQGREGLLAGLRDLERLADAWRRFQSDACYVDDDGESC